MLAETALHKDEVVAEALVVADRTRGLPDWVGRMKGLTANLAQGRRARVAVERVQSP